MNGNYIVIDMEDGTIRIVRSITHCALTEEPLTIYEKIINKQYQKINELRVENARLLNIIAEDSE